MLTSLYQLNPMIGMMALLSSTVLKVIPEGCNVLG